MAGALGTIRLGDGLAVRIAVNASITNMGQSGGNVTRKICVQNITPKEPLHGLFEQRICGALASTDRNPWASKLLSIIGAIPMSRNQPPSPKPGTTNDCDR